MYSDQRSQYIRQKSKKNSFRGNYSRKYGRLINKAGLCNYVIITEIIGEEEEVDEIA